MKYTKMALNVAKMWSKCYSLYSKKSNSSKLGTHLLQLARPLAGYDRDPTPSFFNLEVQQLLKQMTKIDMKKVFRSKKLGEKLEPPEYKFLTSEELDKCVKEAEKEVEERLQIPPIVQEREEINEVYSRDPALTGFDEAKFVFTDITFGVSNKDRVIVVREPDGVLRKAYWDERFRMNQIYFPIPERQMRPPHMFEEPYLKNVLDRGDYEFVLDRACLQYEPNDPEYHRVTSTTYNHIEKEQKFDVLESTRHFGAFAFYLCWHKQIDKFLLHYIQNDQLDDATLLIKLFHLLNPEAKSAKTEFQNPLQFLRVYIETESSRRNVLELALQSYLDLKKQQHIVEQGIKKAHGL